MLVDVEGQKLGGYRPTPACATPGLMAHRDDSIFALFARYSSLALVIPASAFVGYALGYLLDRQFGTGFWSTALLILGVVAGFVKLVQALQKDKGEA